MRIHLNFHLQKAANTIATAFLIILPNTAQAQLGGTFRGLGEFAKKVVIGIETPAASGSGVIIGRSRNGGVYEYYFLTAKHVASSNPQNEEFIVFSKSENNTFRETVSAFIHPPEFEEIDLAIGTFESRNYYAVAPIFALGERRTYDTAAWYNGKTFNDSEKIQGDAIVAGISVPSGSITVPVFRTSPASIQDRAPGNLDGYEMLYVSPSTVPGMSGGGLFGARLCPNWTLTPRNSKGKEQLLSGAYGGLLAIHGRSEGYGQSGSRSGTSLGIPLDLIKRFLKNAEYIPSGENYKYVVVESCLHHNVQ